MRENTPGRTRFVTPDLEEAITKKRAAELFDREVIAETEVGTFQNLSAIHRIVFGDIYDFAGEIRRVNLVKGDFLFAPEKYLEQTLASIEKMPQGDFEAIVEKYIEMNIAHPFRDGNGRSTRIWLDQILKKEIGKVVCWREIPKDEYLLAMAESPVKDTGIKRLLKQALTNEVGDRDIYLSGIDQSYHYEGFDRYKTQQLL